MNFINHQQSWSKDISNDVLSLFRSSGSQKNKNILKRNNNIQTSFGECRNDFKKYGIASPECCAPCGDGNSHEAEMFYGSIDDSENVSRKFSDKNYSPPMSNSTPSSRKFKTSISNIIFGYETVLPIHQQTSISVGGSVGVSMSGSGHTPQNNLIPRPWGGYIQPRIGGKRLTVIATFEQYYEGIGIRTSFYFHVEAEKKSCGWCSYQPWKQAKVHVEFTFNSRTLQTVVGTVFDDYGSQYGQPRLVNWYQDKVLKFTLSNSQYFYLPLNPTQDKAIPHTLPWHLFSDPNDPNQSAIPELYSQGYISAYAYVNSQNKQPGDTLRI